MSTFTIAFGFAAVVLIAAQALETSSRTGKALSPADLVGGYTIVAGEKFGIKDTEDRVKGSTVRFTEDRIVVTDKEKKEVYGATYTLEPCDKGCRIVMTSKLAENEGQVARGLIEKDGDALRLIYALPGGEEPTEFKTRDRQLMFEMRNLHK
jgi:uncharacterized protein (TIGR03067 family)